ncbi:unnamed protein product, partial [Acanthoscelides obtectus]
EQINTAKKLIEEGKSKRKAAEIVGIDESTLRKRLKPNSTATSMGRYQPTFTREQEEEIYNHCKACDDRFYGLTLNALRKLAYEFAEVNKISNKFDKTTKMASKDWVYEFIKRHPDLALKLTTPTSLTRIYLRSMCNGLSFCCAYTLSLLRTLNRSHADTFPLMRVSVRISLVD